MRAALCAIALSALVPAAAAAASPTIATTATDAYVGGTIHDEATLSDGLFPTTGTITFSLYGPSDPNCETPIFSSQVAVGIDGTATSAGYTPSAAGEYLWIAVYDDDPLNGQASGTCGDGGETSTVSKYSPTIATTASDATIGQSIHDDARLSGASTAPAGTVTFRAYGPDDPTCSGPAAYTGPPISVSGSLAGSGHFWPASPGAYRWTTYYSGDGRNSEANGLCNDPGEKSIVKAIPALTTSAADATIGDEIDDTATLSGAHDPSGTITFLAYGPDDASCTDVVFNSGPVSVSGNGSYSSGGFSPPASGTYRWKASYSGDVGNTDASAQCGVNATSTVTATRPTLASVASDATIGETIHDTAILSGGYRPGGTITFRAYGPANTDCTGTVAFNSGPVQVSHNGFYVSGDFSPPTTGTYRWTASYSGDAENASASSPCNSPGGTSTVALNDVRPADRDSDGIPDSIDDCPTSQGPGKTNGCTPIERVLSLKYRRHAFRGTLTPANACGAEEKVTLLAKRHGRTRKVGAARTNSRGRYAITAVKRKGSYYVRSLNSLEPTVGLCLATQSKRIIAG